MQKIKNAIMQKGPQGINLIKEVMEDANLFITPSGKSGRPSKDKTKQLSREDEFKAIKKALEKDPEWKLQLNRQGIEAKEHRAINIQTTKDVEAICNKMQEREALKEDMQMKYFGNIRSSTGSGPIWGYVFPDGRDLHFPQGATLIGTRNGKYTAIEEEVIQVATSISFFKEFDLD